MVLKVIPSTKPVVPNPVSILVLLDMVLKEAQELIHRVAIESFNPCFAGYGSKSHGSDCSLWNQKISFNPCFAGYGSKSQHQKDWKNYPRGFNPCFAGYGSKRFIKVKYIKIFGGFNPCFAGYGSKR